jgi:hypothetical protein
LTDDFAGIGIDDEECFTAAVRGVDAATLSVDRYIIEAAENRNGLRRKRWC